MSLGLLAQFGASGIQELGTRHDGFNQRFAKHQPLSATNDVRRYFVTPQESGELCLMSCLLGGNRDIFVQLTSAVGSVDLNANAFDQHLLEYNSSATGAGSGCFSASRSAAAS